jgi:hypothetical protein
MQGNQTNYIRAHKTQYSEQIHNIACFYIDVYGG